MKNMKRCLSLLLALLVILAMAGCGGGGGGETTAPGSNETQGNTGGEVSGVPDYLNMDGQIPIVKEGADAPALDIWIVRSGTMAPYDDTWTYKYVTQVLNVQLNVTEIMGDALATRLSTAFASDELPDVILGATSYLTASRLVTYANEGQLVDLAPYINETYMPNLTSIYEKFPNYRQAVTDAEGHVWSFGLIMSENYNTTPSVQFINYDMLERLNLKEPQTLDEFMDTMRAMKTLDPSITPIGGGYYTRPGAGMLFLNALGYLTNDPTGQSPALRNGKVVYPAADREVFGEYIKLLHTCYEEGLIDDSFFTLADDKLGSDIADGKIGFLGGGGWPYLYADVQRDWWGLSPLTSQWNDTKQWPKAAKAVSCGGFVVTSKCKCVELACRLADFTFKKHNYNIANRGPHLTMEADYLFGLGGWYYGPPPLFQWFEVDMENNDRWNNINDYLDSNVRLWPAGHVGYFDDDGSESEVGYHQTSRWPSIEGVEDPSIYRDWTQDGVELSAADHALMAEELEVYPFITFDIYPTQVYLEEDLNQECAELQIVVSKYANTEIAKFVTGVTPINDQTLATYFDTIGALGADRMLEIYQDYYEVYLANQ